MYFHTDINIINKDKLTDFDAISASIDNILSFNENEILFNNTGIDLENFLFKEITELTAFSLRTTVLTALANKDPRIKVVENLSDVVPNYDNNSYDIVLVLETIVGSFEYIRELQKK